MAVVVRVLLGSCLFFLAAGCNFAYVIKEDFDRSSAEYERMLRWQEFEKAKAAYVDPAQRDGFQQRVLAARDVKIVDVRVVKVDCDPKLKKAEVVTEIDYYQIPSTRVRTVTDTQKWRYVDEKGLKGWRLESLLPEFR